jgi:hypothetical protein
MLVNAVIWLLCGGDGLVAAVERFEKFPESYSELAAGEFTSDSMESWRTALALPETAKEPMSGPSIRLRTLGDGPSPCGNGGGTTEEDGPRKKVATAWEAMSYIRNPMSSSLRRFPGLTVLEDSIGCFPLLFAGATSLRLVKEPSSCGTSISTSTSLLRSTMMSPLMAHPAVPYPPAFTEGYRPYFVQNKTILSYKMSIIDQEQEHLKNTHLLTSSASKGIATALEGHTTFPLNMVE